MRKSKEHRARWAVVAKEMGDVLDETYSQLRIVSQTTGAELSYDSEEQRFNVSEGSGGEPKARSYKSLEKALDYMYENS